MTTAMSGNRMKRSILLAIMILVLATAAHAQVPNAFADGDVINARAMNDNFRYLLDLIVPVGTILAWHKLANVCWRHMPTPTR